MHKVRAVAWRPRRPHGVQWRCHGDAAAIPRRSRRSHCAHLGVLSFSCTPCSRREDATLQGLYKRRPSDMRCVHFNFIWLKLIKIRVMLETFGRIWHNVFVFHWCGVWYMDPSITNRTWCVMFVLCLCFFFFFSIALFVVVICKLVDTITVILISYVFRPMHKMFKYV